MLNPNLAAKPGIIRRRDLLRRGAAFGALAGIGTARMARGASAARVLKMGHIYSRSSQLGAGAAEFTRILEARTGGEWQVEDYPNGILGGEVEMLDALRKGELDVALITAVALSGVVPEFGVFDLPFLFRDASHAHAVLDGPLGQDYLDKFSAHDLIALAWGENGVRHITNSKRPVRTPEDLRGLRMRVPQSEVTLRCFRKLGIDAAPLGFPALYGALESGRFDGQENPIATIRSAHFERVQRYLTLTGHVYSSAIIFMSKDVWDDLAPTERDVLRDAASAGGAASRKAASHAEWEGVEALRYAGMQVELGVDSAAFLAALEPVWSELAEHFGWAQVTRIRNVT